MKSRKDRKSRKSRKSRKDRKKGGAFNEYKSNEKAIIYIVNVDNFQSFPFKIKSIKTYEPDVKDNPIGYYNSTKCYFEYDDTEYIRQINKLTNIVEGYIKISEITQIIGYDSKIKENLDLTEKERIQKELKKLTGKEFIPTYSSEEDKAHGEEGIKLDKNEEMYEKELQEVQELEKNIANKEPNNNKTTNPFYDIKEIKKNLEEKMKPYHKELMIWNYKNSILTDIFNKNENTKIFNIPPEKLLFFPDKKTADEEVDKLKQKSI
jgi:hypothetical protein